jgi:hypothetical protein
MVRTPRNNRQTTPQFSKRGEIMVARKKAHARELMEPHAGDKRYMRRDDRGQFHESDDVSRSLSQDFRRKAKTVAKKGQGDKGDRHGGCPFRSSP